MKSIDISIVTPLPKSRFPRPKNGGKTAPRERKHHELLALEREALTNAVSGQSTMNYRAIVDGFVAMGIEIDDIRPRENIFTFHAWCGLGRCVRKGQHGVSICTFVPMTKIDPGTGEVKSFRAPRQTTVFHISQTELLLNAQVDHVDQAGQGVQEEHANQTRIQSLALPALSN